MLKCAYVPIYVRHDKVQYGTVMVAQCSVRKFNVLYGTVCVCVCHLNKYDAAYNTVEV